MTDKFSVTIAVEGDLDQAVLSKILTSTGVEVFRVYGKRGKDYLRENIYRYNQAAKLENWVVMVDLNNEFACPPILVESWLPEQNKGIQLRVAVKAVEAWLLADREGIAKFLRVSRERIPLQPENEVNPKLTLINAARRSRNRRIREDILPSLDGLSIQGPAYTSRMIEFTIKHWDLEVAAKAAPNLARSLISLSKWKRQRI